MKAVVAKYLQRWAAAEGGAVKAYEELKLFTFEFIVAVSGCWQCNHSSCSCSHALLYQCQPAVKLHILQSLQTVCVFRHRCDACRSAAATRLLQVVLGRDYNDAQVAEMMQLYQSLVSGILGWPYLELPFTPYGRAMAARRQLVGMFQEVVDEARGRLARGEELGGVVGSLVKAENEEGNRWACVSSCVILLHTVCVTTCKIAELVAFLFQLQKRHSCTAACQFQFNSLAAVTTGLLT